VGSSDTYYYLSDGLGSTMALTDDAGDVDTTWDYDVFGAVRDLTGSQPNDFTFAGEQVDGSTGLRQTPGGRGACPGLPLQRRFGWLFVAQRVRHRDPGGLAAGPPGHEHRDDEGEADEDEQHGVEP
jgi:hypothetical protein